MIMMCLDGVGVERSREKVMKMVLTNLVWIFFFFFSGKGEALKGFVRVSYPPNPSFFIHQNLEEEGRDYTYFKK